MTDLLDQLKAALADRYDVQQQVGQGGMATVYLAQDRRHHRPVALKVLHPHLALSLGPDRFLREIQIAARLQHPHIVPLYDSGRTGDFLYYVMPYVEGESLRQRLQREGKLPIEDALAIARAVAAALDYAHRQHVVHRDIKPENVMLHEGEAVVTDFGIAKAVTAAGQNLTQTGTAGGTPAYMSPEQAAMSGLEFLRAISSGELPRPPIAETIGFAGLEVDEGRAVFHAVPAEYHYNPIGVVHGGLAATLLDSAMGCAVHSTLPAGASRWLRQDLPSRVARMYAIPVTHVIGQMEVAAV